MSGAVVPAVPARARGDYACSAHFAHRSWLASGYFHQSKSGAGQAVRRCRRLGARELQSFSDDHPGAHQAPTGQAPHGLSSDADLVDLARHARHVRSGLTRLSRDQRTVSPDLPVLGCWRNVKLNSTLLWKPHGGQECECGNPGPAQQHTEHMVTGVAMIGMISREEPGNWKRCA